MSKRYSFNFPWLSFLWSTIIWSMVAMLVLGAAFWYFGQDLLESSALEEPISTLMVRGFATDIFMVVLVLVPCFYTGMFACVYFERRGGRFEKQFETIFRSTSTILFLVILIAYAYIRLLPLSDARAIDMFNAIRLIIIYYIFDANVSDRVWTDIFEKR